MLKFQPKIGSVVYCDYTGFVAPEMIKKRPVIVISKHKHHSKLLSVVPISTVIPRKIYDYQIEMDNQFCKLYLFGKKCWVKCDMFNVVSLDRLNLVKDRTSGLRHTPNVGIDFLTKVKNSIRKIHDL